MQSITPVRTAQLAVLTVLRWNAENSTTPESVEEWHRYTCPMLCDPMINRLCESSCLDVTHIEWLVAGRYVAFVGDESTDQRQRAVYADTRLFAAVHGPRR